MYLHNSVSGRHAGRPAGTIFDDLVDEANYENLLKQTDDICSLITKLPPLPVHEGQHYPAPYMTIMDWGHGIIQMPRVQAQSGKLVRNVS